MPNAFLCILNKNHIYVSVRSDSNLHFIVQHFYSYIPHPFPILKSTEDLLFHCQLYR